MEGVPRKEKREVRHLFGDRSVRDIAEFQLRKRQRAALRGLLLKDRNRTYYRGKARDTVLSKLRLARDGADAMLPVRGGGDVFEQGTDFDDGEFCYDGREDWCDPPPYDSEAKAMDICVANACVVQLPPYVGGDPCTDEFVDVVGDAVSAMQGDKDRREAKYKRGAEDVNERYYGPTHDEETWALFYGNDVEGNNVVARVPFGASFKLRISDVAAARETGFVPALCRWMEGRGNCLPNTVRVRMSRAPGTRGYIRGTTPGRPATMSFATVVFPNVAGRDKCERTLSFMGKKGQTIFLRIAIEDQRADGIRRKTRFRVVRLKPQVEEMRVGADRLAMESFRMTYHKWYKFSGVVPVAKKRSHVQLELQAVSARAFRVEALDVENMAPMLADSFDIEAASSRGSKFMCDPNLPGDQCFMICHNLSWKNAVPPKFARDNPEYEVGTSFMRVCQTCIPCASAPDGIVDISSTERDLLNRFRDLIAVHWRVDAIDGWNIFRFDNMYIGKRADLTGALRFGFMSPLVAHELDMVIKNLSTNAVGSNAMHLLFRMRVRMDGFMWDKASTKRTLGSGLDNVLKEELGVSGKLGVTPADMNWVHATRSSEGNAVVAAYCFRDTRSKDLLEMMGYIDQAIQQATMTFTPEDMLVVSGQQEKIMSYLLRMAHAEGYVVTGMGDTAKYASTGYAGGLVIKPNPGQHRCAGWVLYKPEEIQRKEVARDMLARFERRMKALPVTDASSGEEEGEDAKRGKKRSKKSESRKRKRKESSSRRKRAHLEREEGESMVDDMEPMSAHDASLHITRMLIETPGLQRKEAMRMAMRSREKLNGVAGTEDFASLYPSLAREHNICFTTHVAPELVQRYRDAGDPVKGIVGSVGTHYFIQYIPEKVGIKEGRARAMLAMDDTAVYDERGVKMYDRRVEREGDAWFQYNDLAPHIKNRGFEGLIPKMERTLMAERTFAKQMMKAAAKRGDKLAETMWDCRQKAIKVIMNSIYGFTGVTEGRYPFVPVADAITAAGSRSLKACVHYIESTYNGKVTATNPDGIKAVVVYGDTGTSPLLLSLPLSLPLTPAPLYADSVMVKVLGVDPLTGFRFLKKIEDELTALFGESMAMEFEDIYAAFTPQKSKMYSGLCFAAPTEEVIKAFMRGEREIFMKGKMRPILNVKIKGLKPVRRDNAKAVRDIIKAVLEALYNEDGGGLEQAIRVLQERLGPMVRDELSVDEYITTEGLQPDGGYAHIDVRTHKMVYPPKQLPVVWGIEREGLGYTPSPGDRVRLVVVKEVDGKRLIPPPGRVGSTGFRTTFELKKDDNTGRMVAPICVRTRSPEEMRLRGETLDRTWYIYHQLMNPLLSILFSAKPTVRSIMRRAVSEMKLCDRIRTTGDGRDALSIRLGVAPITEFERKPFVVLKDADESLMASIAHTRHGIDGTTTDIRFEKLKSNKGVKKGGAAEKKLKLERRRKAEKAVRKKPRSVLDMIMGKPNSGKGAKAEKRKRG